MGGVALWLGSHPDELRRVTSFEERFVGSEEMQRYWCHNCKGYVGVYDVAMSDPVCEVCFSSNLTLVDLDDVDEDDEDEIVQMSLFNASDSLRYRVTG